MIWTQTTFHSECELYSETTDLWDKWKWTMTLSGPVKLVPWFVVCFLSDTLSHDASYWLPSWCWSAINVTCPFGTKLAQGNMHTPTKTLMLPERKWECHDPAVMQKSFFWQNLWHIIGENEMAAGQVKLNCLTTPGQGYPIFTNNSHDNPWFHSATDLMFTVLRICEEYEMICKPEGTT